MKNGSEQHVFKKMSILLIYNFLWIELLEFHILLYLNILYYLLLFLSPFREPPFLHALLLLEEFKNRPKRRETGNAEQGTRQSAFHKQRADYAAQSEEQENPPRTRAEVIFCFNDYGVEHSDNQECCQPDERAFKVHIL